MPDLIHFSLTVLTSFFAIMNPIANTPIFMGLTEGYDNEKKKKIAKLGCLTAFLIVAIFTGLGKYIFDLFDLTIPAFKITGGILIFYVGFEMLMSKKSTIHNTDEEPDDISSIAISPLAIPILSGPGTIVTAMNYATNVDLTHMCIIILCFATIIGLTYIAFISSQKIVNLIGKNIIAVIGKLMGLVLAIIGMGMITTGIQLSLV